MVAPGGNSHACGGFFSCSQVLSDYTSDELDLTDEKVFRDLKKPSKRSRHFINCKKITALSCSRSQHLFYSLELIHGSVF